MLYLNKTDIKTLKFMEKVIKLYDYNKIFEDDIRISYRGPFDNHVISIIGEYITNVLKKDQEAGRKLYKIFFELAQNISFYSAERNMYSEQENFGVGILLIREDKSHYYFQIGNQVKTDDVKPLLDKCEYINSLDYDELRAYKREQRKTTPGYRGGAHIGLIQVALTSASPINVEVTQVDDENSFLEFLISIKK